MGDYMGDAIGVIKWDTRSLDDSLFEGAGYCNFARRRPEPRVT